MQSQTQTKQSGVSWISQLASSRPQKIAKLDIKWPKMTPKLESKNLVHLSRPQNFFLDFAQTPKQAELDPKRPKRTKTFGQNKKSEQKRISGKKVDYLYEQTPNFFLKLTPIRRINPLDQNYLLFSSLWLTQETEYPK